MYDVSIHALLAECDKKQFDKVRKSAVSIHALLAECDSIAPPEPDSNNGFNPRTPCGVRQKNTKESPTLYMFQSTHSLRSATGELGTEDPNPTVSIHALLAECDIQRPQGLQHCRCFNPRTPCGVRRDKPLETINQTIVSIHALLAECDKVKSSSGGQAPSFNPRTPCGVRQNGETLTWAIHEFQSTHSLRSATKRRNSHMGDPRVSIHALLAECDNLAAE